MKQKTKEKVLKPLDFLFAKFYFFVISAFALIILFHNKLEELALTHIVTNKLDKIKRDDIPIYIFILVLTITIIYFARKCIRRYVYSSKFITIYLLIIFCYSYYRIGNIKWNFLRISEDGFWAYFDLLYLFLVGIIFSKVFQLTINSSAKKATLLYDIPLEDPETQNLFPSRANQIDGLSELLININSKYSYAVGLRSPWGTGKTSFLNFLMDKIKEKDDDAIIINFYPWYSKSEKEVITHFLGTLSDSLKEYHGSLNTELQKYTDSILALEKNKITELIEKGIKFLSEQKDIKSQFDDLNKCIKTLNRSIYVTLDDVDRLFGKEIIECLKIIRNTANFQNVIFIVAYDNDYVLKELNEQFNKNGHNKEEGYSRAEKYLEKIFQLPFTLPTIEQEQIITYLINILITKNISDTGNEFVEQGYYSNPSAINNIGSLYNDEKLDITYYIDNIRIANNILNSFLTANKLIGDNTELTELFLVNILKTLYPKEALELYLHLGRYITFSGKVAFKDTNEMENSIMMKIDSTKVEKKFPIFELNNEEKFINLVSAIFFRINQKPNSASINENYKFYYRNAFPKSYLTDRELEDNSETITTFIEFINQLKLNDTTKLNYLSYKLSKQTPVDKKQASIYIAGILLLQEIDKFTYYFDSTIQYLNNFKNESIWILKEIINSEGLVYRYTLINLIFEIKQAYLRKIRNPQYPLIIDIEDGLNKYQALSLELLQKRVQEAKFDVDIYNYYYSCSNEINTSNHHIIDPAANKIMKDFISLEENKLAYIKTLIIPKFTASIDNTKVFRPFIDQTFSDTFGDYSKFEEFLQEVIAENSDDADLKMIGKQWQKYKENDYDSFDNENEKIKPVGNLPQLSGL